MPTYEFGPFRLDPAERLLLRGQQPVPLKPKAFDLLVLLVERHGRLLTKQQLMDALWPATAVEEGNLTHTISTLRKALGDGLDGDQFIETVPTRGYRFVSAVREVAALPLRSAPPPVSGSRTPNRLIAFALLAAIVAGVATWWRLGRSKEQVVSSDHILTRLTADAGLTAYPAISADGKLVAYASDRGAGNLDIWVQQIAGRDAARLTQDAADDYEPSFSPDGTRIAFRSNRDGGGIYMVSALGGEAKLVAPDGGRPRFSPDGHWLAYWVGHVHLQGDTYVIPVEGGQPRRIIVGDHLTRTRSPVWSPDGQRLLVSSGSDWWIAPLDGGSAIKTGAASIFQSAALQVPDDVAGWQLPPAEEWKSDGGGAVIFSAISGDSRNLWKIALNPETGLATSPPARFTFGTDWELQASAGAGARTVFASMSRSSNIWSLPVDTNSAKVTGDLERLTLEGRHLTRPDISLDGRILVYQEEKNRKGGLRLRNMDTGLETNALDSDQDRGLPALTADGSRVVYITRPGGLYTIAASGGVPTTICETCGPPESYPAYSPTGDRVAYSFGDAVMQFDVSTGSAKRIADRGHRLPQTDRFLGVVEMRYSPDGRWLAFHATDEAGRGIFLIDVTRTDGKDAEWIPATTEPATSDARVAWSPDGNLLYFVSDRDSFRCIWAQRLEAETKRPVDRPVAVYHFHQASRRISHNVGRPGVAVARDKIVLALEELRGNVWMLEPHVSASGQPGRD
jgi:eukaryotic-like serine/threonine-protein kinase